MNRPGLWLSILVCGILALALPAAAEDREGNADPDLAADMRLLQGSWEMLHSIDNNQRAVTIRSVKTIEGNKETLRRYDRKTGKLLHEHAVEFQLSKSGSVRVFTFYPVGGTPQQGLSCIYKVDENNFYDIPGLLQGETYRNYSPEPAVWHWKRVVNDDSTTIRLIPVGEN